jgi:hypothetical protein
LHGERVSPGLSLRPGERLRVGIDPDDLAARMKTFYEDRQVPGAAADLEDPLVWLDAGLID